MCVRIFGYMDKVSIEPCFPRNTLPFLRDIFSMWVGVVCRPH